MHIKFKKISIHNFMSFVDQTFDFESNHGLNLIRGKNNDNLNDANECGKSNLWKALTYVLFGQVPNALKNENLVNSYTSDKNMEIVLSFDVDTVSYVVKRGLLKGKSSYLNIYKVEDSGDTDLTRSTISESQKFLEDDIIHCDMTMFLRTVFLTADQNYNFYALKKSDKKEFVEKLFDIGIFGDMYAMMHKDLLQIDKEILAKQNRLIILNKNESNYLDLEKKFNDETTSKLKTINESIEQTTAKLNELKSKKIQSNDEVVHKFKTAMQKINDAKQGLLAQIRTIDSEMSRLSTSIARLQTTKDTRQKLISKHSDILSKLCDDCQTIFKNYYNITQYQDEIATIDNEMSKVMSEIDTKKSEKAQLTKKIDDYTAKSEKALDKITQLTAEYTKLQSEVYQVQSKLTMYQNNKDNLLNASNPYTSMIQENQTALEEERNLLQTLERKHNYLKFAESIVSQDTLRKLIIKDLVVLLNNKIKTYLTKLGAKYYVNFDEEMDHTFVTDKGNWEFNNFSAGGKMRIMIATSFAFRDFMQIRNGITSNILVLDEYFDSAISSNCIDNVMQILQEYSQRMHQNIFIISHRPEMNADMFDRTICVEKTNHISTIRVMS